MSDFVEWLKTATWNKLLVAAVSGLLLIVGMTVFENRQRIYERAWSPISKGDYPLQQPSDEGKKLFSEFTKRYPNIALITVVDADPVANTRKPIYRHFNNRVVEKYIKEEEEQGRTGAGLLYGVDPDANRQTLAIFNAQVTCEDSSKGFFAKAFPGVKDMVGTSCRVPIPPVYGLTTGWLSIHFIGKQDDNPELVMDMLNLSVNYYRAEISGKEK